MEPLTPRQNWHMQVLPESNVTAAGLQHQYRNRTVSPLGIAVPLVTRRRDRFCISSAPPCIAFGMRACAFGTPLRSRVGFGMIGPNAMRTTSA